MNNHCFYVVLAANGAFIHPRYDRAVHCRDNCFRGPKVIRKFGSIREAQEAAIDHLWEVVPVDRHIPDRLEVDTLYYAYKFPYND